MDSCTNAYRKTSPSSARVSGQRFVPCRVMAKVELSALRFGDAETSSPVAGIHNTGTQCIEIESAIVANAVNKEPRRAIHPILHAAPKMLSNEIMVAPGLQLIVYGTPGLFINGIRYAGGLDLDALRTRIVDSGNAT